MCSQADSCLLKNGVAYYAAPDGNVFLVMSNFTLAPTTGINCLGDPGVEDPPCLGFPKRYVVRTNDIGRTLSIPMPPRGQFDGNTEVYNGDPCQIHFLGAANADGFDPQNPGDPTGAGNCVGRGYCRVVTACLTVTKECDYPAGQTCFPYGAPIRFKGTISFAGDAGLYVGPLVVSDVFSGPIALGSSNLVFAAVTSSGRPFDPRVMNSLLGGESVAFTGSYLPLDAGGPSLCGPFTDPITVSTTLYGIGGPPNGVPISTTDPCWSTTDGRTYFNSGPRQPVIALCNVCTDPRIVVTKSCPPTAPFPGAQRIFSGFVRNAGNVPLRDVVIVNDHPVPNTLVTNYPLLHVGAARFFLGSYPVPTNVCSLTDTLMARGTNICTGLGVSATDTKVSPLLVMARQCPPTSPGPGQDLVFTSTIVNAGNVAITNIVIVNSQPVANTPVTNIARLEPAAFARFTGRYRVPTNVCSLTDTLTATGRDICGNLTNVSITAACPVANRPALSLTVMCPSTPPPPGELLPFTAMVTHSGNIGITRVSLTNQLFGANTWVTPPVVAGLEPGRSALFSGYYLVPTNSCAVLDSLTALGLDLCGTPVASAGPPLAAARNGTNFVVSWASPAPGFVLQATGTLTATGPTCW